MSIDDKLREILLSNNGNSYWDEATAINEIKQAFADDRSKVDSDYLDMSFKTGTPAIMSGQEWYERFEKELVAKYDLGGTFMVPIDLIKIVANRAAGIDGSYKHLPNAEVESQDIMKEQI